MTSDTDSRVSALHRRLLLERSGFDRLTMATRMFGTAKRIVLASFDECGITDEAERQVEFVRRFYGNEVDAATIHRLRERFQHLVKSCAADRPPSEGAVLHRS